MVKIVATVKAVVTRLVFAAHGLLAIWQAVARRREPHLWYLSVPIILLFFEGLFTLTVKRNQEWKWFCPSVFLYLGSVVPAIWLLELDKLDKRLLQLSAASLSASAQPHTQTGLPPHPPSLGGMAADGARAGQGVTVPNVTVTAVTESTAHGEDITKDLDKLLTQLHLPPSLTRVIPTELWVTLLEQSLMLALILGRWLLPKGELTREQLSQLLLVYIGTAADIIEFLDSFKEDRVARQPILVTLTLSIWAWSLLQFTLVLTATKARRSRMSSSAAVASTSSASPGPPASSSRGKQGDEICCCSVDAWAIVINMVLQDAPFVAFRLLLIIHFRIVSYLNVFFACKNTLVILLQLYRLYVVQVERRKQARRRKGSSTRLTSERSSVSAVTGFTSANVFTWALLIATWLKALVARSTNLGKSIRVKTSSKSVRRDKHQDPLSGSISVVGGPELYRYGRGLKLEKRRRDVEDGEDSDAEDSEGDELRSVRSSPCAARVTPDSAKKYKCRRKSLSTGNLKGSTDVGEVQSDEGSDHANGLEEVVTLKELREIRRRARQDLLLLLAAEPALRVGRGGSRQAHLETE